MLVLIQTGIVPARTRVIKGKETRAQETRTARMLRICGTSLQARAAARVPLDNLARVVSLLKGQANNPADAAKIH